MAKSLQQILNQIEKLQHEAESLRSKEVAGVIDRIKEAIAHYGLTVDDLFGQEGSSVTRRRAPRATTTGQRQAKFQSDDGRTWSGIGKRPAWFTAALDAGKSPEDLLLPNKLQAAARAPTKRAAKRPASSVRSAGVPKFHDGTGRTWTGRGTRPAWFRAAIASGKSPEDLLIKET